jgi:hypothetical protein
LNRKWQYLFLSILLRPARNASADMIGWQAAGTRMVMPISVWKGRELQPAGELCRGEVTGKMESGIVENACRSENTMNTVLVLLLLSALPYQEQEGRRRVPEDSVELVVTGCLKGRVLSVSDTRQVDTQSGPIVRAKSFRLAGKGDVMKLVKKEDGQFVEVTGIVKRSALDSKGIKIGKRVAVGSGSPVAGSRSLPDPAADVAVMDITSVRHRSTSCAVQ